MEIRFLQRLLTKLLTALKTFKVNVMDQPIITESQRNTLESFFGSKLKMDEMMDRYSVMKVGGPADYLVITSDLRELEETIRFLWEQEIPFILRGGGSNTLISDAVITEVVLLNKATEVKSLEILISLSINVVGILLASFLVIFSSSSLLQLKIVKIEKTKTVNNLRFLIVGLVLIK